MRFKYICEIFDKLEKENSYLAKVDIIAGFIKGLGKKDLEIAVLLFLGRIFPTWSEKEIGLSTKLIIKAMSVSYGVSEKEIEKIWVEKGDLGLAAVELSKYRKQKVLFKKSLEMDYVFNRLRDVSDLTGKKSIDWKLKEINHLLSLAEGVESKYIVRIVIKDLRIGVAEGMVRDALIKAFFSELYTLNMIKQRYKDVDSFLDVNKDKVVVFEEGLYGEGSRVDIKGPEDLCKKNNGVDIYVLRDSEKVRKIRDRLKDVVEKALEYTNDYSFVAVKIKEECIEGLKDVKPEIFKPIKVMLAQKVKNIEDAFETLGKKVAFEYKYDGFRVQIHRKGNKVKVFTRRLEDVTKQFPDIVENVLEHTEGEFIVDGEAVGIDLKNKKYVPFQNISQRIKRKYGVKEMVEKMPVKVNVFDVMYYNGKNVMTKKFKERRGILSEIVNNNEYIGLSEQIITDSLEEAKRFYKEALEKGNEGVMAKKLEAEYKPGSRVGHMLKIKPIMDTLDLAIIGAEWGEGKRKGVLSSFILGCKDVESGRFLSIGKLGTGIKEKSEEGVSFKDLTDVLKEYIVSEKGKKVKIKPFLVVEVAFEEIQKSPKYESGYALRFPRLVQIREDKDIDEVDDLNKIEMMYKNQ